MEPARVSGIFVRASAEFRRGAVWILLLLGSGAAAVPATASPAEPGPHGWLERVRWLDRPALTAAQLRGRVVVVEFWTSGCVNCIRTVPALRALTERFGDGDVVVIGVHTPEFDRERESAVVRAAVARLGIRCAVALDNDEAAWRAFDNHAWPAFYVLDRSGRVRVRHVGEMHVGTPPWHSMVRTIEALRSAGGGSPAPSGSGGP